VVTENQYLSSSGPPSGSVVGVTDRVGVAVATVPAAGTAPAELSGLGGVVVRNCHSADAAGATGAAWNPYPQGAPSAEHASRVRIRQ
jgi:hypothetical protein